MKKNLKFWEWGNNPQTPNPEASFGRNTRSFSIPFDGEKNVGEVGPIIEWKLDFKSLSLRSWQSYLESEISKTILSRYCSWIIDKGLKLQSTPSKHILETESINFDSEKFNENVESRFNVWSQSKNSSFSGMQSLNEISKLTFKNANIGGDCLVILRYENNNVNVQLVDGYHIGSTMMTEPTVKGNRIIDGVEIDSKGKHIAYHIQGNLNEKARSIKAWSESTGLRVAFLVYGSEYRLDNVRGMPIIATSLESLKKLDRYKEAAVGGAEERQKVAFFVKHDQFSDGENPMGDIQKYMGANTKLEVPVDVLNQQFADQFTATSDKTMYNLPIGSDLGVLDSKQELFFKEFHETIANIICSNVGIPPNVAWSIYNDSFSASRAATKDWEHTINLERDRFKVQFYDNVYAFWFHMEVLNQKISAPGYISAFLKKDFMVTESFLTNRFTGPKFPHIDPLKEVKAERLKLGSQMDHIPLTTLERAAEDLMSGDSVSNVEQSGKEITHAEEQGIVPVQEVNNDFTEGD